MSNRKQRMQNRDVAKILYASTGTCPECGGQGKHWIGLPRTLQDDLDNEPAHGFWTCPNLYGENGRRLEP